MTTAFHAGSAIVGSILIDFWIRLKYSIQTCLLSASLISLVVALFIYLAIPETKGIKIYY